MIKELENKIGQLQYEISLLGLDREELTGVTIITDELKDLVKNLSIHVVSSMLPNINSNTFKNYLEAKGYAETLNPLVYKKQGFEYDKEILHRHFLNEIEFGN